MDDYKKMKMLINEYVKEPDLKIRLLELVETEARRERWELEKKRRYEVSLDIVKTAIKVELEISLTQNDSSPNIHGYNEIDVNEALIFLSEEEQNLIDLLFFCGFSEREVARLKGVSQNAIHKQKQRILMKLRSILRNFEKKVVKSRFSAL